MGFFFAEAVDVDFFEARILGGGRAPAPKASSALFVVPGFFSLLMNPRVQASYLGFFVVEVAGLLFGFGVDEGRIRAGRVAPIAFRRSSLVFLSLMKPLYPFLSFWGLTGRGLIFGGGFAGWPVHGFGSWSTGMPCGLRG